MALKRRYGKVLGERIVELVCSVDLTTWLQQIPSGHTPARQCQAGCKAMRRAAILACPLVQPAKSLV